MTQNTTNSNASQDLAIALTVLAGIILYKFSQDFDATLAWQIGAGIITGTVIIAGIILTGWKYFKYKERKMEEEQERDDAVYTQISQEWKYYDTLEEVAKERKKIRAVEAQNPDEKYKPYFENAYYVLNKSEREIKRIETHHKEIRRQEQENKKVVEEKTQISVNLDFDKYVQRPSDLNEHEIDGLLRSKFKLGTFVPIGKTKQEEFLIRHNTIESLAHTFLVNNIADEIRKTGTDATVYITTKPDIVFTDKNGNECAIEVETGINFKKKKKEHLEKFQRVQDEYGKNAVVVLTSSAYKRQYKHLLPRMKVIVRTEVPAYLAGLLQYNGPKTGSGNVKHARHKAREAKTLGLPKRRFSDPKRPKLRPKKNRV